MVVDLPRAGDAGQEDDPLVVAGDLAEDRWQAQALEVGDRRVDAAGDQAEAAALREQVDAEPGLIAVGLEDDVGEVDAAGLLEDLLLPRGQEQREHQPLHVLRRSARAAAWSGARPPVASRGGARP